MLVLWAKWLICGCKHTAFLKRSPCDYILLQFYGHFLSADKTDYPCSFEDPVHKTAKHCMISDGPEILEI